MSRRELVTTCSNCGEKGPFGWTIAEHVKDATEARAMLRETGRLREFRLPLTARVTASSQDRQGQRFGLTVAFTTEGGSTFYSRAFNLTATQFEALHFDKRGGEDFAFHAVFQALVRDLTELIVLGSCMDALRSHSVSRVEAEQLLRLAHKADVPFGRFAEMLREEVHVEKVAKALDRMDDDDRADRA